jgi:hypothetical protein
MTEIEKDSGMAIQDCLDDLGIPRGFVERKVRARFVGPDFPRELGNISVIFRRREINEFAFVECNSDQLVSFLKRDRTLRTAFDPAWTRFQYSEEHRELSVESPDMPIFKLRF